MLARGSGVWHDGVMFDSELLVKSIARRVFLNMGEFSSGTARIGLLDARLGVGEGAAWLTVSLGQDHLFQIEVRGSCVEATYALPTVMEYGDGKRGYGTAWANSYRWNVTSWADVPGISADIDEFFNNIDEFIREEARVYRALAESSLNMLQGAS